MLNKFNLAEEALDIVQGAKSVTIPKSREELLNLVFPDPNVDCYDVGYDVNGEEVLEANVVRCKNGVSVNYLEDYMRRRDPNCTVVSDHLPTDKPRFVDKFGYEFDSLRKETFEWLKTQDIILMPFMSGGGEYGYESILIAPKNSAFFATALADLQHFIAIEDYEGTFTPRAVIYLAPPFRHTHFDGKQIVVHNRLEGLHELYAYNLYPGPSAKKGIYGVLLNIGEEERWITAHASTVKVITPYENEIVIMHEGASGGGKSEMIENIHREPSGKIVIGKNTVTGEKYYLSLEENCDLLPVTDDMALCHPSIQNDSQKLSVTDAEEGWFLRVDNIKNYGTEPMYEKICTQPSQPLVFLNLQGVPNATCLIWEHTLDSNGKPCPNPRVILPRKMVPRIVSEPVDVDVRSFGVRVPSCTAEHPSYGIMGILHILPPALAWLWRLVAPRGYNNPSIIDSAGMTSEGVGSYWPFATGKMVTQANLLLEQIINSPNTRYVLIPNQHVGCYEVGFMPQWISREYIARRGNAKFNKEHLVESRCSLLGYSLDSLKVDGQFIPNVFIHPETQPEMGHKGYDDGAKILSDFFKKELENYNVEGLDPLGKKIIESCLNDATIEEYLELIPMKF